MEQVDAAIMLLMSGDPDGARHRFVELWDELRAR
jgi:hypothetical protein